MRPDSIENRYIQQLEPKEDRGFETEDVVIKFLNTLPHFDVRYSSEDEDSGRKKIIKGLQLDAIAYIEGRPAMGIQITSGGSSKNQTEKIRQMKDKPFLRLPEMKTSETAIPKVLVYLDSDKDPELAIHVLDGILNSLKFDLTQTKNPQEKLAVNKLIQIIEDDKKAHIH
jgi:hypothetical protein